MDISERREAQELQSLLTQELSHRLKNQLAMVQGIVNQSLRGARDAEQARHSIASRLAVLSQAHDLLRAGPSKGTTVGAVIEQAVRPHESEVSGRFETGGPPVAVGPRVALSLALIVHELATNAVKYGALSSRDGKVRIRWTVDTVAGESRFDLEWRETGGPAVNRPVATGFGSRLIRAGLASASSRVDIAYAPEGLVCTISVPVAELAAEAE
jgi:two-component sensor histidine kinase